MTLVPRRVPDGDRVPAVLAADLDAGAVVLAAIEPETPETVAGLLSLSR